MRIPCNVVGAALIGTFLLAPSGPDPAGGETIVSAVQHTMSPTGEILASWQLDGSSIDLYSVADNKVVAKYDAGFVIDRVEFSMSGRFLCIDGVKVRPAPEQQPLTRLAVIDLDAADLKPIITLNGTIDQDLRKFYRCMSSQSAWNPKLEADHLVNRMVRISMQTDSGKKCGGGIIRKTTKLATYWDPLAVPKPDIFRRYGFTELNC